MRNLTNYPDRFILGLMEECNINPHKATANVQLSVQKDGSLVECLNIWQELPNQFGWDELVTLVFSERKNFIDFCDEIGLSAWDAKCMMEYYDKFSSEAVITDYEIQLEDYYSAFELEIMRDIAWMNNR